MIEKNGRSEAGRARCLCGKPLNGSGRCGADDCACGTVHPAPRLTPEETKRANEFITQTLRNVTVDRALGVRQPVTTPQA